MNFYTSFVADNAAAKASVFTVKRNVASFDEVATHPLSAFCTDYLGGCTGFDTTGYKNSFCNPDATDVALWENDCSAHSATVAATALPALATPVFSLPTDFYQATVTLPGSLSR
jgi:hypothetical protein